MAGDQADPPIAGKQGYRVAGRQQGLALILGSTLSILALVVLAPVVPDIMRTYADVPNAAFWVPSMVGVAGLGAAAFSPFAGFIGDRYGRRGPLIAFCVAFAVFGVFPFFGSDFTAIYLSRIGVGIAATGVLVLSTAMIGDCFAGPAQGRWLTGQAIAATASGLVVLPVGGYLGTIVGWRGPFLVFLVGLPFTLAYWLLFRDTKGVADRAGSVTGLAGWSELPWRWLLGICAISVLAGVLGFAVQLQIGLAFSAVGLTDPARIGLYSGVAFVGIPLGALLFMPLSSWPFPRLVCLQLAVLGTTLVALSYVTNLWGFLAVVSVNLIFGGMILPTFLTHVAKGIGEAVRARAIGIWQAAFPLSQFLTVALCSAIIGWNGTNILDAFRWLGLAGIGCGVVGWLVFARGALSEGWR